MSVIRSTLLLIACSGTLHAQAATTRPTTAPAGAALAAGSDLVIDSIDLVVPVVPGFSVAAENNAVRVTGLYVIARITNRGGERWAARGSVGFRLSAGREEDEIASSRRAARGGVSVVPESKAAENELVAPFVPLSPFGPFSAETTIPGSLGPGESRMIKVILRTRDNGSRIIFERDKYYTVLATIRARGDTDESNNRSARVVRVDAAGRSLLLRWEPLALRPSSGGSVQVNRPPQP
jgi:hypothetical protein